MEHDQDALVAAMQRVNDEQARVIDAQAAIIAEMERKSAAMTALNVVPSKSNYPSLITEICHKGFAG
jgi:hypothetical protein